MRIKVKIEKPAKRCEICHQTDWFNPIEKHCRRCNEGESLTTMVAKPNVNLDPFGRDMVLQQIENQALIANVNSTPVSNPLFSYNLDMPLEGARIGALAALLVDIIIVVLNYRSFSYTPRDLYSNFAYIDLGLNLFSAAIVCIAFTMFIGFLLGFIKKS